MQYIIRALRAGDRQVHTEGDGEHVAIGSAEAMPDSAPCAAPPRVCVIVTCFNYGRYIREALQSIREQTYPDWQCVIVDDASDDDSRDVVEQWLDQAADPRFHFIKNDTNQGQIASIIEGLSESESEFVALLDADDFWFPDFLRRHVEVHLNRWYAVAFTCSDEIQVDAAGRALSGSLNVPMVSAGRDRGSPQPIESQALPITVAGRIRWPTAPNTAATFVPSDLFRWHWATMSAMMFRRSMLNLAVPRAAVLREPKLKIYADACVVPICHYFTGSIVINETLGAYRRHGGNQFAKLPVLGARAFHPGTGREPEQLRVLQTTLQHVLDRKDDFLAIFGRPAVRRFVRAYFRYLRSRSAEVDGPRIRAVIGRSRYYRDQFRHFLGLQRRGREPA